MKTTLSSRQTLLIAFGLLLAVLLAVSVAGIVGTEEMNRRLQSTIHEHDAKTAFLSNLVRITRERSHLVHQLFSETDAAERVRASERYALLGQEFVGVSNALRAMSLVADERAALDRLEVTAANVRTTRDRIVELLFQGDTQTARALLDADAAAAQDTFQQALYDMLEKSRMATMQVVRHARTSTREALLLIALVGTLVLAGAAIVAVLVTRQVNRTEYALQDRKSTRLNSSH